MEATRLSGIDVRALKLWIFSLMRLNLTLAVWRDVATRSGRRQAERNDEWMNSGAGTHGSIRAGRPPTL